MRNARGSLLVVAVPAALVAALGLAGPAAAHGDTIHFQIAEMRSGHPQVVATWEDDGDPVDEEIAGTLSAVSSDGHAFGPWTLVALQGTPSALTTREALPAGRWTITVECSFPALGRGEAVLTVVAASGAEQSPAVPVVGPTHEAAPAITVPTPAAAAPVTPAGPNRSTANWTVAWLVAAAVLGAGVVFARRRRSTG